MVVHLYTDAMRQTQWSWIDIDSASAVGPEGDYQNEIRGQDGLSPRDVSRVVPLIWLRRYIRLIFGNLPTRRFHLWAPFQIRIYYIPTPNVIRYYRRGVTVHTITHCQHCYITFNTVTPGARGLALSFASYNLIVIFLVYSFESMKL